MAVQEAITAKLTKEFEVFHKRISNFKCFQFVVVCLIVYTVPAD